MDEQRKREYALGLAESWLDAYDYLSVVEDSELEDEEGVTEQDLEDIYELIIHAQVVIPDV